MVCSEYQIILHNSEVIQAYTIHSTTLYLKLKHKIVIHFILFSERNAALLEIFLKIGKNRKLRAVEYKRYGK